MTFDYELTLINYATTENEIGDPVTTQIKTPILCDVLSVTRSEHYAADARGMEPQIVFVVNQYEYNGEKDVEYDERPYKVLRTYKVKNNKSIGDFDKLELVCGGMVNHATT